MRPEAQHLKGGLRCYLIIVEVITDKIYLQLFDY